jgi:alpha-N-arabinofuranosidase
MANFTFATSLLSASRTAAVLNPAGLLFKLYRDHFGAIPVTVSGNAPQTAPRYPSGGEEPLINAGSPTYPPDVAAAWAEDRTALTVAVINPTEAEQTMPCRSGVCGSRAGGRGGVWLQAAWTRASRSRRRRRSSSRKSR